VYPVALFVALAASLAVLRLVRQPRRAGSREQGRPAVPPAGRPAGPSPARRATATAPGTPRPERRGPADPAVMRRYAESVAAGAPLSQKRLAGAAGVSDRQARNAIAAVKAAGAVGGASGGNGREPAGVAR
jgi:hypothetical protein